MLKGNCNHRLENSRLQTVVAVAFELYDSIPKEILEIQKVKFQTCRVTNEINIVLDFQI